MSQFDFFSARASRTNVTEFVFGPYRLRTDDLVLRCRGTAVPLAPKVALTLIALLERAGQVVSKEELFQTVWGGAAVEESNLSQNIYTLRRHFEATSGASLIETLPRRGYRMNVDVRVGNAGDPGDRKQDLRARSMLAGAAAIAACGILLILSGTRANQSTPAADPPPFAADQAYWTGWMYYREGTEYGFRAAVRSFQEASVLRPSSPIGQAGEAVALAQLSDDEGASPSGIADGSRAEWLAHHQLASYQASSEALAAKGFVEFDIDGDFIAATRDLKRAELLNPQNANAYFWYGAVLLWQGRLADARAQLLRATRLDSTLPGVDYMLAWDYYFSRDFGNAIAFAKLAVSDPFSVNEARLLLAAADDEAGRFGPAIAAVAGLEPGPTDDIAASATRAHVYANMGDSAAAARELRTVERLTAQYKQRPLLTAVAYLANGRLDETFAWLSRLSQYDRTILAMDPRLDPLRRDPRFARWLHG
jgi:DNA-binding winged helix-turn-helix (wHTH) protein/tetratricopeptide (TPR) repeat protein